MLPCSVRLADPSNIDVETFEAFHVVFVVFASCGVGQTVRILEEYVEPVWRPFVYAVTVGQMLMWIMAYSFVDSVRADSFLSFQLSRVVRGCIGSLRFFGGGASLDR